MVREMKLHKLKSEGVVVSEIQNTVLEGGDTIELGERQGPHSPKTLAYNKYEQELDHVEEEAVKARQNIIEILRK
jgi:hypothetical protein